MTFNAYPDDSNTPDVVIFGAPFDALATGVSGQREAPALIRTVSDFDPEQMFRHTDGKYASRTEVIDIGDAPVITGDVFASRIEIENLALEAFVYRPHGVVLLGGDDSVCLPFLRAIYRQYGQPTIVHCDAHLDVWPGNGPHGDHGTWVRQAIEEDLASTIDVCGVRALGPMWTDPWQYRLTCNNMASIGKGIDQAVRKLHETTSPVFLAFDIDVVDPAFAPGTGFPEPGGWTSGEALSVVRALRKHDPSRPVFMAVTEVCPPVDQSEITALLANRLVIEFILSQS